MVELRLLSFAACLPSPPPLPPPQFSLNCLLHTHTYTQYPHLFENDMSVVKRISFLSRERVTSFPSSGLAPTWTPAFPPTLILALRKSSYNHRGRGVGSGLGKRTLTWFAHVNSVYTNIIFSRTMYNYTSLKNTMSNRSTGKGSSVN